MSSREPLGFSEHPDVVAFKAQLDSQWPSSLVSHDPLRRIVTAFDEKGRPLELILELDRTARLFHIEQPGRGVLVDVAVTRIDTLRRLGSFDVGSYAARGYWKATSGVVDNDHAWDSATPRRWARIKGSDFEIDFPLCHFEPMLWAARNIRGIE